MKIDTTRPMIGAAKTRADLPTFDCGNRSQVHFGAKPKTEDGVMEMIEAYSKVFTAKEELLASYLMKGYLPLSQFAKLNIDLDPQKQKRMDAYKQLVRAALRQKGLPPKQEERLMAPILNPSADMKSLMAELKITVNDVKEPVVNTLEINARNQVPPEVLQRQQKLGLYALKHAKEAGGGGLHFLEYAQILGEFADMASNGTPMTATNTIGTNPIADYGTPAQKAHYVPQIVKGDALVAFALTELGDMSGADFDSKQSVAKLSKDGKNWELNGDWIYITGLSHANLSYFVTSKTFVNGEDKGPSVFMVRLPFNTQQSMQEKLPLYHQLAQQGMEILPFLAEEKEFKTAELDTLRGSGQNHIHLKNFKVPVHYNEPGASEPIESVLGGKAFIGRGKEIPLNSLNGGRITFPAMAAACAKWLADEMTDWATDRKGFTKLSRKGNMIGIQDIRGDINEMHARAALAKSFTLFVLALCDENQDKGVAGLSAMAKAFCTDQFKINAEIAHELHGGAAHIKGAPNMVAQMLTTAQVLATVEGPNRPLRKLGVMRGSDGMMKKMKDFNKRMANWVQNQKITATLVQNGQMADLKKHYQATGLTSAPIIPQVWELRKALFHYEKGELSHGTAWWVQKRMRELALKSYYLFVTNGGVKGLSREGYKPLRMSQIFENIVAVVAAETVLKRHSDQMSPEEKVYLQGGIKLAKNFVDSEIINLINDSPDEQAKIKMGEAAEKASIDRLAQGIRENSQARHKQCIDDKRDTFIQSLKEQLGEHSEEVSTTDENGK